MGDKKYKFDPVYDLKRDMIEHFYNQFNIEKLLTDFNSETQNKNEQDFETIADKLFGIAGESFARTVAEIADKEENRERRYQILRQHCKRPEVGPFPHLIQRFIEVMYLSINPGLPEVGFLESSRKKIAFWIDEMDCHIHKRLKDICGEKSAAKMPCRNLCKKALETLAKYWGCENANTEIQMNATIADDRMCKFAIVRPNEVLPHVAVMKWDQSKRAIPVINWDEKKCQTPMACKICLQICPEQVFRSGSFTIARKRFKEFSVDEPGIYKVNPEWIDRCIGCMECVKLCPKDALEVIFPPLDVKAVQKKEKELKVDEPDFILDFRTLFSEPKKYFEMGAMTDKLQPNEVLHILDEHPINWVEKRLRMLRPGLFNVIESKQGDTYTLIVHRL